MEEKYDSRVDTQEHIAKVREYLCTMIDKLSVRAVFHDESKLDSPEVEVFDEVTPLLRGMTYGSDEYKESLARMKPALDHHYAHNSHHPEHYPEGIRGMCLLDLVEMLCDWKAAALRHADGDLLKSIELNQKRFGYSDELKQIFLNTVKYFEESVPHAELHDADRTQ